MKVYAMDRINQIRQRLFNSTKNEENVARSSNPISGGSNPFFTSRFQKNILMEGDVFVSKYNKSEGKYNIGESTKRMCSALVGSISDFGKMISDGIESIKAFGAKIKSYSASAWNKIQEIGNTEVRIGAIGDFLSQDVTKLFGNSHNRQVAKLAKLDPVTEVKPMLTEALSALEKDYAQAA